MRPFGRLSVALVLLACAASSGGLSRAMAEQPDLDATVRDAARAVMRQYNIPGLAIAVTTNGKRRFYNYGVASRETRRTVTSDTLFEIGRSARLSRQRWRHTRRRTVDSR